MFKIGDIVGVRKLPESCNLCEQLNECRVYVGSYFDAHEIEYIDAVSADISKTFYRHSEKLDCIQYSLKISLDDIKYNHDFIKNGVYIVYDISIVMKSLENYGFTKEEVFAFKELAIGHEYEVQGCEIHTEDYADDRYRNTEIIAFGIFLDPELQELYDKYKYEDVLVIKFKHDDYALYRHDNDIPDQGVTRISL